VAGHVLSTVPDPSVTSDILWLLQMWFLSQSLLMLNVIFVKFS